MKRVHPLALAPCALALAAMPAAADTFPQPFLSQDWSNPGLITIDDDWTGVPGIVGRRGDHPSLAAGTDPQTVLTDEPTVDVIANQASPNTLTNGGVAEFDGLANPVVALQGSNTADTPFLLLTLDASEMSNITLSYTLRDIDGSLDDAVTRVALQYRIGSTGNFTNVPAGYVADATTGPGEAHLVTPVSVLLPSAVNFKPVVQIRIMTSNDTGTDEWVGVDDIAFTMPPPCFADITQGLTGVDQSAAAWGDYDNDGDLDLLISGNAGGQDITRVYRNSGGPNPVFTDIQTGLPGVPYPTVAWGDYDADGDLDILLAGFGGGWSITKIYRNNGGPNPLFTDTLIDLPGAAYGCAAWGDYDNDGDLDLLLGGVIHDTLPYFTRVYRNSGGPAPTFTDADLGLAGVRDGAVAWGDYDLDGDLDILITGDTQGGFVPLVYRNEGGPNPTFADAGAANSDAGGLGLSWGDHDADGDLDILVTGESSAIWTNRVVGGIRFFQDMHPNYFPGAQGGVSAWADYDNDGRLDFLTAGLDFFPDLGRTLLYRQIPAYPFFTEVGEQLPGIRRSSGQGRCAAAWGDADGDHDLDLVLTGHGNGSQSLSRVYRNECASGNTRPSAPTGLSATFSGTRATFRWDAATDAETPSPGLSYNLRVGTSPGAGDVMPPMALPSGTRTVPALGNAMQNMSWSIDLPGADLYYWSVQAIDGSFAGSSFAAEQILAVNTFAEVAAGLVNVTAGATAWGDYDGDGDMDLLLAGSTGASATTRIYRNDGGAAFTDTGAGIPGMSNGSASWTDVDNDGDLDALVTGASAGVATSRLYRNTGGTFADMNAGLTGTQSGGSAWGDVDGDGDPDLLLTGLDPTQTRVAKLHRNSGGANPAFTEMAAGLLPVGNSAAAFCDYDGDGDLDVLIAGATGGAGTGVTTLYRNGGGADPVFTDAGAGFPGLASPAIAWGDYDGDGAPDLALTGNDNANVKIARIYRNEGGPDPTFTDIGAGLTGVHTGAAIWADADNDGDLDLLVSGHTGSAPLARIYRNGGGPDPVFEDGSAGLLAGSTSWLSAGDIDGDHDVDLVLTGGGGGAAIRTRFYENDAPIPNTRPAPPSNLSVNVNGSLATFSWTPATDTKTPAAALTYNLRVGTSPGAMDVMAPMAAIPAGFRRIPAPGNAGQGTSHTIELSGSGPWYWSVQAIDAGLEGGFFAPEATLVQSGVGETAPATGFELQSGGPNPFSRATEIRFSQPVRGPVTLDVHDVTGRLVRPLVSDNLPAGTFARSWDGCDAAGTPVPSGLYFVRMSAGGTVRSVRLSVIR